MLQLRYILLLSAAWVFLALSPLYAATADSSVSEVRRFDRELFNDMQKSREYRYPESREAVVTLMDRIKEWLRGIFGDFDPGMPAESTLRMAGYLIIFVLILFLAGLTVWLLMRSNFSALFTRRSARVRKAGYEILEEDIHKIAYTDEIQKAVNEGNFRKAVRLQYLRTLKLLADNNIIYWSIERTNSDFRKMMRGRADYKEFDYLATAYEFIWYGYKQVSEEEYGELARNFSEFNGAYREVEA